LQLLLSQSSLHLSLLFETRNLLALMNKQFISVSFLGFYLDCLRSESNSIQITGCRQLGAVCSYLSKEEILELVAEVRQVDRFCEGFRRALAEQLMQLPALLGKRTTTEALVSLFLALLKDQEVAVRIELLNHMQGFIEVLR